MAKKPVSLLHLHEFLRKVWDERDRSKDDWDNGEEKEGNGSVIDHRSCLYTQNPKDPKTLSPRH